MLVPLLRDKMFHRIQKNAPDPSSSVGSMHNLPLLFAAWYISRPLFVHALHFWKLLYPLLISIAVLHQMRSRTYPLLIT